MASKFENTRVWRDVFQSPHDALCQANSHATFFFFGFVFFCSVFSGVRAGRPFGADGQFRRADEAAQCHYRLGLLKPPFWKPSPPPPLPLPRLPQSRNLSSSFDVTGSALTNGCSVSSLKLPPGTVAFPPFQLDSTPSDIFHCRNKTVMEGLPPWDFSTSN